MNGAAMPPQPWSHEDCVRMLAHERRRNELLTEQLMKFASIAMHPIYVINPNQQGIAPTKETKLNVKENAAQYLDQVKSHLANVEGQLASTKAQLDIRTRELKDAKAVTTQPGERALYVNLDGSTRNAPVLVERRLDLRDGYAPMREVRFEEVLPLQAGSWRSVSDIRDSYPINTVRRIYRLTFSQRGLHVYQEIG